MDKTQKYIDMMIEKRDALIKSFKHIIKELEK